MVTVSAYGHNTRSEYADTHPAHPAMLTIRLPQRQQAQDRKIRVNGVKVTIVSEGYEERDADGNLVSPQDYLERVQQQISRVVGSLAELQMRWVDPIRHRELIHELEQNQVALDILTEILARPDADAYDLLAHLAFDEPMVSRDERAVAFFNLHQDFFNRYDANAREILRILVEKYTVGGIDELLNPDVYRLRPIEREVGQVAVFFGGMPQLKQARNELLRRLYQQPA